MVGIKTDSGSWIWRGSHNRNAGGGFCIGLVHDGGNALVPYFWVHFRDGRRRNLPKWHLGRVI